MKKLGKFGYISIGAIVTLILSFTVLSFAEQPSNQQLDSPTQMDGNLTGIDKTNNKIIFFDGQQKQNFTLNPDTVIYRNGQKSSLDQIQYTDDVKLTFNSQHIVRYVVATAVKQSEQSNSQAQSNNTEIVNPNTTPKQSESYANANSSTNLSSDIRELQLHIDYGQGTNYEIHYNIDPHGKMDSHIHKKTENEDMDFKDGEATNYIRSLIQQIRITGNMSDTDIIDQLKSILKINDNTYNKLDFKLKFSDNHEINIHSDSKQPKGEKKNETPKEHKK